ncbi:hypothetical protein Leryth_002488 [Lithospermum erythrorhizon]|nr:hypothetical protein Leryth_002488 [Lithospermum erythrorhizon]
MMVSRSMFFIVFTFLFFMNHHHYVSAVGNFLHFRHFTHQNLKNITLSGDSHLRHKQISLTKDPNVPSLSSGSMVYNNPLPFFDRKRNASVAYFATMFTFRINNKKHSASGDGLTFFISAVPPAPTPTATGEAGYFGLVNAAQTSIGKFIAIEFDTKRDLVFKDPEGDHVGLDIDSLVSVKTAEPKNSGIDLKSGALIYASIYYHNDQKKLQVYLNDAPEVPDKTAMEVDVDLSPHFEEQMFVGFSASSSNRSTELHHIKSWDFWMNY